MPVVAIVDGVKILVYYDDHPPPHVHAEYGEFLCMYDIETRRVLKGHLPRSKHTAVISWLAEHVPELRIAWEDAAAHRKPRRIP